MRLFTAAFFAAALVASPLHAAPGRWTRIGPEGGDVCALAAAPSRPGLVYAGLRAGGVFRSGDRGKSWTFAGGGLRRFNSTCALAVDAVAPGTVWAGTNQGLFKSTSSGAAWTAVPSLSEEPVTVIAVVAHPRQRGIAWVALRTGGLFQTRDGGASWKPLRNGLPTGLTVAQIALDPHDTRELLLLAAPAFGSVYKSSDGGASWRRRASGLGEAVAQSLAVDAGSSATVYAATNRVLASPAGVFAGSAEGVAVSADRGVSWQTGRGLLAVRVSDLAISDQDPPRLYASHFNHLWKTASRGASWLSITPNVAPQGFSLGPVAVDPVNPETIYAGFIGVFTRSTDGGASWALLAPGIVPGVLAFHPRVEGLAYAALPGAIGRRPAEA